MGICGSVNGVAFLRAIKPCVRVCVRSGVLTVSWEAYGTLQRGAPSPGIQAITSFDGFLELMIQLWQALLSPCIEVAQEMEIYSLQEG